MKKIKSNGFIEKVYSKTLILRIEDKNISVSKKSLVNNVEGMNLLGLPINFSIKNGNPKVYLIIELWTKKELEKAKKEAIKMKKDLKVI